MPFCADIFYRKYERGSRGFTYPVVLLHGAGSTHLGWPYQLRRIPGHRLIALDLPAHGMSDGACSHSLIQLVDRIFHFLQEMRIYQAVFIGYSLGGAIALSFAVHYPQRVRALMVIGCGRSFCIPTSLLDALRQPAKMEKVVAYFRANAFDSGFSYRQRNKILNPMHDLRPGTLWSDLFICSGFSAPEELKTYKNPVAIIGGESDMIAPPGSLRQLARLLPNASLKLISGAGHLLPFEKTEMLNRLLSDFIDQTARYSPPV